MNENENLVAVRTTLLNKKSLLQETLLISKHDVEELESLIGSNFITDYYPIYKFTNEPSSILFKEAFEKLTSKLSDFNLGGKTLNLDDILREGYELLKDIDNLIDFLKTLDFTETLELLTDERRRYVYNSDNNLVDLRDLPLIEAIKTYNQFANSLLKQKAIISLQTFRDMIDGRDEDLLLKDYTPLLSLLAYIGEAYRDENTKIEDLLEDNELLRYSGKVCNVIDLYWIGTNINYIIYGLNEFKRRIKSRINDMLAIHNVNSLSNQLDMTEVSELSKAKAIFEQYRLIMDDKTSMFILRVGIKSKYS